MFQNQCSKLFCCAAIAAIAQPALAQNYPNKPIRFIVGFAPGGPNDILARIVGQKLSEGFGVPMPVDNRPGADSMIGTQLAARATPDGYTICMLSASATIHPSVYQNVPYDVAKDFSHVSILASGAFVVVVNPQVPVKTVKDLIALAKSKPGALNFASSGTGGTLHLASELFKSMAHVDMNHVPYKGGAPAATDVVSGQVQLMFSPIAVAKPHVKANRLRMVAVTSAKRWPSLPDVPAIAETIPGYEATGWYGIVAPAKTPRPVVMRLNQEIVKAVSSADVKQQLASFDLEPIGSSPGQMTSHINDELQKWAKVARDAKLTKAVTH
ncbi:MAG TPA: tripartite tricarboxylate transporter substrate binding protein [Burkholderiales bacterium]|nr:tripartite tricarboxylate transporter substrate binding protein [Burkholderiales bacterium]